MTQEQKNGYHKITSNIREKLAAEEVVPDPTLVDPIITAELRNTLHDEIRIELDGLDAAIEAEPA